MIENKEILELEYLINTSPGILFNRLTTPSGLSEWFADDVNVKGNIFTFRWSNSEQFAEQSLRKENKMVRYTWVEDEDLENVVIPIENILFSEMEKYAGNRMILYRCKSIINNRERLFELKFEIDTWKWYLYRI